ncbi:hypothetical protein [Kocuria salsicia]|uniref:hypothetical protein n=1 Tax=Kocuria salsicia TaxID=664639 RepID=UPI001643BFFD|nr:hypothetical protein [Kocuria salsicia]
MKGLELVEEEKEGWGVKGLWEVMEMGGWGGEWGRRGVRRRWERGESVGMVVRVVGG